MNHSFYQVNSVENLIHPLVTFFTSFFFIIVYLETKKIKTHLNSVLANFTGPPIFVRYNRVNLYIGTKNYENFCSL
jgi:hypothetical protein